MREVLFTILLAPVGGLLGFGVTFLVAGVSIGSSHAGAEDAFVLANAGAIAGAIGLPAYVHRRRRKSRPF